MKNITCFIALFVFTFGASNAQDVHVGHEHLSQASFVAEDTLGCGFFTTQEQIDELENNQEFQEAKRTFIKNYNQKASGAIDWIPIKAHIIRTSAGTDGLALGDLNDAIDNMNRYYINANMQFYLCDGINYIDDDRYFSLDISEEAAIHSAYSQDNMINIYFSGFLTFRGTISLCGYANYPGGIDVIMLSSSCATNGSTLPHEMGHFYALHHTHGSMTGILTTELVDGSNCMTEGDFVCDTEADPQLGSLNVNDSCIYDGTAPYTSGGGLDANGHQFVPNPNNVMSYARPLTCRNFFSLGQFARINAAHTTVRNNFSVDDLGSVPYNQDYETFTAATNATGLKKGWTTNPENTTSAFRWNVDVNGTPSIGTGPTVDNTLGTSSGHYMHVEATSGNINDVADLLSSCIDLNVVAPELSFAYHMHGIAIGELHLDIYAGGAWTNDIMTPLIGEQTANQNDPYSIQNVDLTPWTGQIVQLRFRAIRGNALEGDIAIDDINIQCVADAPMADFTTSNTTTCIGDSVIFTDASTNAVNWLWDFGDGATTATVSGVGPHKVVYTSEGLKTISLIAIGDCSNDTLTKTNYVSVVSSSASTTDVSSCDSLISPSTNYVWFSTGTYFDTIPNVAGCDSFLTINLTINNSNAATDTQVACDNYTWPLNDSTYSNSTDTSTVTLSNAAGCDSIVTLNLTINNSNASIDTQIACDNYTWPLNDSTYSSSTDTHTVTLTNEAGCDSIVTLNLTINNSNASIDTQTACDSYTWPLNDSTYSNSTHTPTVTLTNAAGCDSIVTLNLTINDSNASTDTQVVCDTYTWPLNDSTYSNSTHTPTVTLTNAAGCDSIVTLNLTINNSNASTDTQVVCDTYTWPLNDSTYSNSTHTPTVSLTNAAGCDSIVTLNLTINNSNASTDTQVVCDIYTWPLNDSTYSNSTHTPTVTLTNAAGCDSIVTLNLTINNSSAATDTQVACISYTWPLNDSTYLSSTNTPTVTLTNTAGCDSIVTLVLTINSVLDNSTSLSGKTIQANNSNASYVWLDCDDNFSIISGETNQSYTPSANGNYAVELTENGCVDTSECVGVTTVAIIENDFGEGLLVFPNPTDGQLSIDLGQTYATVEISISGLDGKLIRSEKFDKKQVINMAIKEAKGLYLLTVLADDKMAVVRLIKN